MHWQRMRTTIGIFSLCCVFLVIVDRKVYADINLTPGDGIAVENSPFTFICSFNTSDDRIAWKKNVSTVYVNIQKCQVTGFLKNHTLYNVTCGIGWISIKILNVSLRNHGIKWQCLIPPGNESNEVTLQVNVPVKNIDLVSTHADIKENSSATFNCTTSPSRPPAVVFWFLKDPMNKTRDNVTEKATQTSVTSSNGLKRVFSTIAISFGRKYNAWKIYCVADVNVTSEYKHLNILYPPNKIEINRTNDNRYTVVEGNVGNLSCSVYGGNPRSNITWICYNSITPAATSNNTFSTSTISWTASRKQDGDCFCVVNNPFGRTNKTVNISILYPPDVPTFSISNVKLNETVAVILNKSLFITCKSNGNPMPNYSWGDKTGQNLNISRLQIQDSGMHTCNVTNEMVGTDSIQYKGKNTSSIIVNVLYPPSSPDFHFLSSPPYTNKSINGGAINVIKGDKFSVACVSTANPTQRYRWEDGQNKGIVEITATNTSTKVCTAYNNMLETVGENRYGSANGTLKVNVHYPPKSPAFCFKEDDCFLPSISKFYKVVEEKPFNLTCKSEGNPSPNYKWYASGKEILHSERLSLILKRNYKYKYMCSAFNTMVRTFGDNVTESSNSSINIDVLYPASVQKLENDTVLEGYSKNITCKITPGNPKEYRVSWMPPTGTNGISKDNVFQIYNITREDEGKYTCYANTTMIPDNGPPKVEFKDGSLYLNVEYRAVVKQFYGQKSEENSYTVEEYADAVLSCIIDSKPPPFVNISFNGGVVYRLNKTEVHLTKSKMQCSDSGNYTCSAVNIHNQDEPSSRILKVFVNCSPRPSPKVALIELIAVPKYSDAELNFTAIAYPKPSFKWFFVNDSHMIFLQNDSNYLVLSSSLQTKLILTNVTESRYGQYILEIENTIDKYQQNFSIVHHDVPDTPVILNWTSTKSEIRLTIASGFNGGHIQQFIIRYAEENGDDRNIIYIGYKMPQTFNHTIYNLRSGKKYQIDIYAHNILGNSTTVTLFVETKVTQTLEEYQNMTGLYIGIVCGVLAAIGISIGIVIFLYKKRNVKNDGKLLYQNVPFTASRNSPKKTQKKIKNVCMEQTQMCNLQDIDDEVPDARHDQEEYINSAAIIEGLHNIKLSELFPFVLGKDEDSFSVEYQKLPMGLVKPCTFARKPENLALNRYNGIYPYDHSRVKLNDDPDFFINACYIDGYKKPNSYIASLGPTSKTTSDFKTFWKMVWYCKSDIIVMLTNLHEPSGMKCEQYWPIPTVVKESYGDVDVYNESCEVFAEYTVRTFTMRKGGIQRTLTQLHFTAWPDKTVPEDTTTILEFRQRIKATPTDSEGPIIVHCSAGIGRTGTLIAIDILINEGIAKGSVNVFQCIYKMREQRTKMVQTLNQYIYIHRALVNALSFDSDTVSSTGFQEYMSANTNTFYNIQYQQLNQSVEKDNKEDTDARTANRQLVDLNRQGADIPASRCRVFLYVGRGNGDTDYINAVYMNSFQNKDYFITAQTPLPNTVRDFLSMLYQENCVCIVTMEDMKEPGMAVGKYLPPENRTLTFREFTISCTRLETREHSIVRKVVIKFSGDHNSGEKVMYHFQYKQWMTGRACPVNARNFVQFVKEVEEYERQFGDDNSHVLAHCLKANERCGLFCAVNMIMEKMKIEGQVNIPHILRHLRTRRSTIIQCMEQLKFCYKAASAYAEMLHK